MAFITKGYKYNFNKSITAPLESSDSWLTITALTTFSSINIEKSVHDQACMFFSSQNN